MTRAALLRHAGQRGFTLVEAIIVIVITGILGGIVAMFIRMPVQNYVDSAARAEMTDIADTTLRRLAREVRLAVPNSIRLSGSSAIEFLPSKTGGRYLAAEDGFKPSATMQELDFIDPTAKTFTVVGTMPVAPQNILKGDYIVVYNLGPGFGQADAYSGGNVARVDAVSGNVITMVSNPFAAGAAGDPALSSPGRRFQVVVSPVMYVCNLTQRTLTRYSNYALSATMTVPPTDSATVAALLANNVSSCAFNYGTLYNAPSALLGITIGLQRPNSTEAVALSHQVHVDNVP